ncbi:MAG TPA: TonB-dependent receptor [Candidatus Eisenbacteria bacterium]
MRNRLLRSLLVILAIVGASAPAVAGSFPDSTAAPAPALRIIEEGNGVVRGRLTKTETGEPLAWAYVTLTRLDQADAVKILTSNADGYFSGEVAPGHWSVLVEHLLWPAKKIDDVEVRPSEALVLDLSLTDRTMVEYRGHVVDGLSPTENVSQANVLFQPVPIDASVPPFGAVTGADGRFSVRLPTGVYEVSVLALNYARTVVSRVAISPGINPALHLEMLPEAKVTVQEINVRGNRITSTAVSELQTRRLSAAVTDGISRETIRKGTDADAAQVLGRVTGVSVKDGKFLVVRGMSERYTSTQVNGVRVGSPETNRKVVPMDIFPASLLDNVVLQKTWTPDLPGDFGGASVQITTREVPETPVFSSSFGAGMRSGTTGEDGLGYTGGALDFLGIDDGSRGLPDLVSAMAGNQRIVQKSPLRPDGPGFSKDDFLKLARSFNPEWSVSDEPPPLNSLWNMAVGRRMDVMGRPLGFVGALAYQNTYVTRSGDVFNYEDNTLSTVKGDYDEVRTTRSVLWGGIGNLSYRLGESSSVKLNTLYTLSSDDEARRYEGYYLDIDTDIRVERLQFQQRDLFSGTLAGQHGLPVLHSRIEWKLNRSDAHRDEPDRRENFYAKTTSQILEESENGSTVRDTTYWGFSGRGADRLFSYLDDQEMGTALDWTVPFRSWADGDARLRMGWATNDKDRVSWTRRFTYRPLNGIDLGEPVDSVLANDHIGNGMTFTENTRGTDYTWADQSIDAWYLVADLPVQKRMRLSAGARLEKASQGVSYYSTDVFTSDILKTEHVTDDFLPGVNVTWAPGATQNIRASWSKTVNRPDLRELSPTEFTEYESGASSIGNPGLRRALITSYDLRWEAFPTLGELLSISGFYKKLTDAIESNIQGGEFPRKQPVNTPEGRNIGVELEARLGLGRLSSKLQRFGAGANLVLVDSEVSFGGSDGVQTSRVRPLTDQSGVVGNLALFYTGPRSEASVYFNHFGRRLTDVGVYGQPDVYEEGRLAIDAAFSQRLGRSLKLKLVAKNVTNSTQLKTQGGRVREEFATGAGYGLSLSFGD